MSVELQRILVMIANTGGAVTGTELTTSDNNCILCQTVAFVIYLCIVVCWFCCFVVFRLCGLLKGYEETLQIQLLKGANP